MKKIKILTSLGVIMTLALALLPMTTALAAPPTKTEYPQIIYGTVPTLCPFPIDVALASSITQIDHIDQSGALTRIYQHVVEQDTFTANGKTLVSLPYTFNVEILFDSSGNLTHIWLSGFLERVKLPDGSHFYNTGRIDITADPAVYWNFFPARGHMSNVEGFCAALSE